MDFEKTAAHTQPFFYDMSIGNPSRDISNRFRFRCDRMEKYLLFLENYGIMKMPCCIMEKLHTPHSQTA